MKALSSSGMSLIVSALFINFSCLTVSGQHTVSAAKNNTELIPMTETVEGNLVLWNRLGSADEVQNSMVGPNGLTGLCSFVEGPFGKALEVTALNQCGVTFPVGILSDNVGCIEFWASITPPTKYLPWGKGVELISVVDAQGSLFCNMAVFNGNDGEGRGGLLAGRPGLGGAGTGQWGSWTYTSALKGACVTNWHHYAMVWDINGVSGLADPTRRWAVYVDGTLNSGYWGPVPNPPAPVAFPENGRLGFFFLANLASCRAVIDNVKVWNCAKTDFSNRFDEDAGYNTPPTVCVVVTNGTVDGAVSGFYETGTNLSLIADLPPTGYHFAQWLVTPSNADLGALFDSSQAETPVIIPSCAVSFTAAWAANSYTVSFDPNGGTVDPTNKTVTFDAAYGALPVPVLTAPIRVEYTFGGWFTGTGGTGLLVHAGTTLTTAANHTLYAKWTPEAYVCDPSGDAPLATAGNYTGYLFGDTAFSDTTLPDIRGTFSLTLNQTAGRLTANAVTRKGSLSFSAKAWDAVENADGTKQVTLTRRGGETLLLSIRQNRIWGDLSGGSLSGETLTLDGTRNRFADRKDTAAQAVLETYKGYYTVSLPPFESVPTGAAQTAPAGSGYLTLTVGISGKVKIAGLLADGTSVSQSSTLILFDGCGTGACVPLFVPLYSRKGSVGALLWFTPGGKGTVTTDRDLGWFVRWEKPAEEADGASVLLDAFGGYYSTPATLEDYYRFSVGTNAVPYHYTGGIADLQAAALPDGIGVTRNGTRLSIAKGTSPALVNGAYDYSAENSARATLTFNSRNGIFKGAFNLYYDYPLNGRLVHKTVSVPYAGVLTPIRSDAFADQPAGQGYYLVPDSDLALKIYRLKRSYPIWLDAAP